MPMDIANRAEQLNVIETSESAVPTGSQPFLVAEMGHLVTHAQLELSVTDLPTRKKPNIATRPRNSANSPNATAQYLNEIGEVPLLTAEEEITLAKKIEAGKVAQSRLNDWHMTYDQANKEVQTAIDEATQAKDQFIRANLRLVVSIAKKRTLPPSTELLDVIQEGNLGLRHAVDKFDWRKGFKFSTYATWWIRQAIGRYLEGHAQLIRIPEHVGSRMRAELRAAGGDGDMLTGDMANYYRLSTPTSLNKPVSEEHGIEHGDMIESDLPSPDEVVLENEVSRQLAELLTVLDPRARHAISLRYGLADGTPLTLQELGDELGITREGARRLLSRAEKKLKKAARENAIEF